MQDDKDIKTAEQTTTPEEFFVEIATIHHDHVYNEERKAFVKGVREMMNDEEVMEKFMQEIVKAFGEGSNNG